MDEIQRQLRIAIILLFIIIPIGTVGFTVLEQEQGLTWVDSLYATIITLSTIGYGDVVPQSNPGRAFAVVLAVSGLSVFAFAGQAGIQLVTSPALRAVRRQRRTRKAISGLRQHYIICGAGELVDKTIDALLHAAEARRSRMREEQVRPVDEFLTHWLGKRQHLLRRVAQRIGYWFVTPRSKARTLLDAVVVITDDHEYARRLHDKKLLVITGDATDNTVLHDAGLERAQAMMVLLEDETETLLTVLTAHTMVPALRITAAVTDHDLSQKMVRVGANAVVQPYETAGQFLNNATFRPAVNDYFNHLMYDFSTDHRLLQLPLDSSSAWVGQQIGALDLRQQFDASPIGIYHADGTYSYAPSDQYILQPNETLIVVAVTAHLNALYEALGVLPEEAFAVHLSHSQMPQAPQPISSDDQYTLSEAEDAIKRMSKHFIICGNDRVAQNAIAKLDPERPFVIISTDEALTSTLLKRGFRVIHGNPTQEETLQKAGIERAQAIMVALEKKTDSLLTILTSRMLNRRVLITSTANSDDMIAKLERAGADRVVSPFHVAARFVLMTTTHPILSGFVSAILYNYQTGLETTEIYVEDESIWIGKMLGELRLGRTYNAGVIGVRLPDRQHFLFAPPADYVVQEHDVLIIVTPMEHSDDLRDAAHGGTLRRPTTLRSRVLQSGKWTPDQIQEMLSEMHKDA